MTVVLKQDIEEKIEEDFLLFLEHFKGSFDALKSPSDKEICQKWLDKLAIETYKTVSEKQARNIYLSQLILSMNDRKLTPPFNVPPSLDMLSLDGVFKHITTKPIAELEKEREVNENKEKWAQFVRNRELEMVDLNHVSNDGRTYVAFKTLAGDSGVFGYVAVTTGGENPNCGWVNMCGQPIPPPAVKPLDLKVDTATSLENCCEQDKMYETVVEVRKVLSNRKSPEDRMMPYQFFKSVYSSIEQEILREEDPNSTACHDPYVEKLLEMLIDDIKACDKFNPYLCKRIKLLSMLKKRVKNILHDIEERNKSLIGIEVASTTPIMTLTNPGASCSNSISEMMWREALLQKPTSKMADALAKTYPACSVKILLALVARERRKIISRLQEKQEKLITDMKKDLQNEIKRGIMAYKVARKEWVDVMRIVMHYIKLKGTLTEKKIGDDSNNTNGDYLLDTIRKEIEDTRKRLDKANRNNEKLQDDICDLNKNLHERMEKVELEQLSAADQIRDLQTDICNEKSLLMERSQTVEQLERLLNGLNK